MVFGKGAVRSQYRKLWKLTGVEADTVQVWSGPYEQVTFTKSNLQSCKMFAITAGFQFVVLHDNTKEFLEGTNKKWKYISENGVLKIIVELFQRR